jgi:hypothetical protein
LKKFDFYIPKQQLAILQVICYYDVFNHPLTLDEIKRNSGIVVSKAQNLLTDLNELAEKQLIKCVDGYYFLLTKTKTVVEERLKKEALAQKIMSKAFFFSRLIGAFPFVEGVCISGSLSKGVLDKDGDVDFFVVTKPSRLWVCRSFLILFKKMFLLNSHKYFCTNYFVDTNNLSIPDKNTFTATEISYLLPVVNYDAYRNFMLANKWAKEFLPNIPLKENIHCRSKSNHMLKRFSEFVLKGTLGEWADDFFFKLTLKQWKRKFPSINEEDFNLNLRTLKTVSKHHPRGYQQKVLKAQEEKLKTVLTSLKSKVASEA